MLSAAKVKDAEKAIDAALKAVRDLFDPEISGTTESLTEKDAIYSIINTLERAHVDFAKLECVIYGFETWRYLSDAAIEAGTWKILEQERADQRRRKYMQGANQDCKRLGLSIPYPEIETNS